MNFRKNLLILAGALFTFGFVACSDDDNDVIQLEQEVATWSLSATSPKVDSENPETIKAIEDALSKSTYSVKYLELNIDGSYESTLNSFDKGVYKLDADSLHLIKAEIYSTTTPSTQSFGVVFDSTDKMSLSEDITSRFAEDFEDVDKVVITHTLDKQVAE